MARERLVLPGIAASPGIAVGRVCAFDREHVHVPRRHIAAEELPDEEARLHDAIDASRRELEQIRERLGDVAGKEQRLLLDAHLLMHRDELLIDGAIEMMREREINAEWGLSETIHRLKQVLEGASDGYFRERANDIEHVGERILRALVGKGVQLPVLDENSILVADDLGPADAAQLIRTPCAGIAIDLGSASSHTAILARALDIPAVVGVGGVSQAVGDGDLLVVDALHGHVVLNPTSAECEAGRARGQRYRGFTRGLREDEDRRTYTRSGQVVNLTANVELPAEAELAVQQGADGIGLYRTEFLFLDRPELPSEEEQAKVYREVTATMAPRPVVLRTFDIGGDKLHSRDGRNSINPALGLRALRLGLANPGMLLTQLRAILRASTAGDLRVMFPLVTSVDELVQARRMLDEARRQLTAEGVEVGQVPVGIMVEVPSAALVADALAEHCDFFSVGTNDLVQYTLALDRSNPRVAYLASPLHPAVLKLLDMTASAARRSGVGLHMCGSMASDPLAIPIVLGLGYDRLSSSVAYLPVVREVIRRVDSGLAEDTARDALLCATAQQVRKLVIKRFSDLLGDLWEEQGFEFLDESSASILMYR